MVGTKATRLTSANPLATEQQPSVISASRRIRNHGRDCSQEPVVQPTRTEGQDGPRLKQRNRALLDKHERYEGLATHERAGQQTPGLNDLREAAMEFQ